MFSFTNVRIQTISNKNNRTIQHNLRIDSPLSLANNNTNILIFDNEIYEYRTNKDIIKTIEKLKKIKDETIQQHKQEYQKLYKSSLKNNSYIEGVLTFSNNILNYVNKEQLQENGIKTIKDICQEMNTKLLYITLHYDEKTPHFHFEFENIAANKKSLLNTFNKKELGTKLQDIAAANFTKYGIRRGIKKEHKKENTTYIKQQTYNKNLIESQEKNIKNNKIEIEQHKENLEKSFLEYTAIIEKIKEIKKEISKEQQIALETKKTIYKELENIQDQARKEKETIKTTQKIIKQNIKKDIENILQNSKNFLGFDTEKLYNNLEKTLIKYSKIEIIDQQLQELKQENSTLKQENQKQKSFIISLAKENEGQESFISSLKNENLELEKKMKELKLFSNENIKLKSFIKSLENENLELKNEIETYTKTTTAQQKNNSNFLKI